MTGDIYNMAKTILITGASSGIGKALAYEMAERGYSVGLTGRNIDLLEKVRGEIKNKFPSINVEARKLDVTDYKSVPVVINELVNALGGIDIFFANAGVAFSGKVGRGNFEKDRMNVETNLIGAMATVDAAVEYFLKKGEGHVVGTSSIVAYRGMPSNASYCASKAGFTTYLEALRTEVMRKNIDVTVLHPGYIDTPLNNMVKNRPFLITVEKGAKIIAKMIEKKVKSSPVPRFPWNIVGFVFKILPARIMAKMG